MIALLDHLNIDRAWFCGISMGGLTGLWLGRFAPERFHGLAVANTAARIGDQASWLSRARAVRQEGMAVVAAGAADRWFTHAFRQKAPEVVEALCHQLTHTDAEGYAACCEALAAADLRGEVGQIPLPTLIIAGKVTLSPRSVTLISCSSRSPPPRWLFWRHRICLTLRRRKALLRRC